MEFHDIVLYNPLHILILLQNLNILSIVSHIASYVCVCVCVFSRLVSYECVYESTNRSEWMKVIISSQYLYFYQESPPDPSTLHKKINLDDLAECRAALGKTSRWSE